MSGRKIARMGMRGVLSVWDHGFLYLLLLLAATAVLCAAVEYVPCLRIVTFLYVPFPYDYCMTTR